MEKKVSRGSARSSNSPPRPLFGETIDTTSRNSSELHFWNRCLVTIGSFPEVVAIGRSNFHVASLTHFKHYNLTTILITINLQQKSVLLQRIFKKCVSPRIHYQRYASLALFFRNHVLHSTSLERSR